VLAIASLVLGLIVGSFLNVVIYRVPLGTFTSGGARSRCPHCNAPIRWYDNIPVFGWLRLRGKARCCGKPISVQYPLVEAFTGVAFWLVYLYHSKDYRLGVPHGNQLALLLVDFYFVATLIAASVIDLKHRILPTVLNYLGIAVGLLASLFLPELHAHSFLHEALGPEVNPDNIGFIAAIAGLTAGAGSLYLVAVIGKRIYRRDALGLGDVKFMAFAGCFIGADGVLIALISACLLGAVIGILSAIKTGDPLIPFGPFLALGVVLARFFGDECQKFLFVDWPAWLHESSLAIPVMLAFTGLCAAAMLYLRRLRGSGEGDGESDGKTNDSGEASTPDGGAADDPKTP